MRTVSSPTVCRIAIFKFEKAIDMKQLEWNGEKNRELRLSRPCECGCDIRDGDWGVGYISGSDESGNGFTVWIDDDVVFSRLEKSMFTTCG